MRKSDVIESLVVPGLEVSLAELWQCEPIENEKEKDDSQPRG